MTEIRDKARPCMADTMGILQNPRDLMLMMFALGRPCSSHNRNERRIGGKRYKSRSRGRSSLNSLAFEAAKRSDDRADYCQAAVFFKNGLGRILFVIR